MHTVPFEKLLGKNQIRDLKSNEVYCCMNGCGECDKVVVEEDEATLTCGLTGALKERFYNISDVSSCCGESLLIWDNETDDEAVAEYVFSKAPDTPHPEGFTSVFPSL
jgi:hypothetical protein